jgi:hypothetical protein
MCGSAAAPGSVGTPAPAAPPGRVAFAEPGMPLLAMTRGETTGRTDAVRWEGTGFYQERAAGSLRYGCRARRRDQGGSGPLVSAGHARHVRPAGRAHGCAWQVLRDRGSRVARRQEETRPPAPAAIISTGPHILEAKKAAVRSRDISSADASSRKEGFYSAFTSALRSSANKRSMSVIDACRPQCMCRSQAGRRPDPDRGRQPKQFRGARVTRLERILVPTVSEARGSSDIFSFHLSTCVVTTTA